MGTAVCVGCSAAPTSTALVGWVVESSGRGTLTLIVTSLFTIFLCTWVVIHPRVCKGRFVAGLYKGALFFKATLAPEFIAVEGLQEWTQCRRMKRNCAAITGGNFKLVHAFYVSMLALRYRTPQGDRVIWPNQFTWLLTQGLFDWKNHKSWGLNEELIRDKSNADSAAKLVAFCQVFWFVAAAIMRNVHGLPLSQLESMTLSYIPLFIATYYLWWFKPKDISTPSLVSLPQMSSEQMLIFESMAVSHKFDDEGLEDQVTLWSVLRLTPRVFEKEAQGLEQEAAKKAKTMARQGTKHKNESDESLDCKSPPAVFKTKEVVVSHWDPELYRSKIWPLICLLGASFGALHLLSWRTIFPTFTELWLWRIVAFVSTFSLLVFIHFEKVVLRWGGPLTLLSIISPRLYFLSRLVMIGQVIAALRAGPGHI